MAFGSLSMIALTCLNSPIFLQPLHINQVYVQFPVDLEHVWNYVHWMKTVLGRRNAVPMGVVIPALNLCWKAVSLVGNFILLDRAFQLVMDAIPGQCSTCMYRMYATIMISQAYTIMVLRLILQCFDTHLANIMSCSCLTVVCLHYSTCVAPNRPFCTRIVCSKSQTCYGIMSLLIE